MMFTVQRFLFGFLLVCSVAILVTGCTNRPAAERWKFVSNEAELKAKPVDYIYAPSVKPDGSLSDAEARKLVLFLQKSGLRHTDKLLVQSSNTAQGENAGKWVAYWLENKKLEVTLEAGSLGLTQTTDGEPVLDFDINPVQIVVRRYKLSVPHCERNMSEHITTMTSTTRATLGCANTANLAHMISNPSHVANGSDPGYLDGEFAASGVEDYWKGETEPLIIEEFDVISNGSGGE